MHREPQRSSTTRASIAIYLLALIVALGLIISGFLFEGENKVSNLLLSLGTELFGGVILFFIADISFNFTGVRHVAARSLVKVAEQISQSAIFSGGNSAGQLAEEGLEEDTAYEAAPAYLQVVRLPPGTHHKEGDRIPIKGDEMRFGRNRGKVDVWLGRVGKISGVHFTIRREENKFYIVDESMNGTYVHGHRLQEKQPYPLSSGTVIKVCSNTFAEFVFYAVEAIE
jgi:hypothetical protein